MTTTLLYGFTTAGATWASSIYSAATLPIETHFHVSHTVSTLGLTLFLFAFGIGPLLWAPLSETYGRKISVLPAYFVGACFCFGTAAAKDIQTVLLTRFFTGFFASAPVTNTGGVLNDIWTADQRGVAILGYSMAVVGGPLFSPIAGAAIVQSGDVSWRWCFNLTAIMMMAILVLDVVMLDESSANVLLAKKAAGLRQETGNWALHAKVEEQGASLERLFTATSPPSRSLFKASATGQASMPPFLLSPLSSAASSPASSASTINVFMCAPSMPMMIVLSPKRAFAP